jgi:hypothetical protein
MKYLLILLLTGGTLEVVDPAQGPCEPEYHEVVIGGKIDCPHTEHHLVYETKPDRIKVWCQCED